MQGLDGFFDLASRKLDWIDQRTRLLAGNVANSDTPGYRSRDLRPFADDVAGHRLALASTDAADLDGTGTSETTAATGAERAPDGNAVSVEHQMKLIADDQQDQQLVTTLYRRYMSLDQTALGISG